MTWLTDWGIYKEKMPDFAIQFGKRPHEWGPQHQDAYGTYRVCRRCFNSSRYAGDFCEIIDRAYVELNG